MELKYIKAWNGTVKVFAATVAAIGAVYGGIEMLYAFAVTLAIYYFLTISEKTIE